MIGLIALEHTTTTTTTTTTAAATAISPLSCKHKGGQIP